MSRSILRIKLMLRDGVYAIDLSRQGQAHSFKFHCTDSGMITNLTGILGELDSIFIDVFNRCLRRCILEVFWTRHISYEISGQRRRQHQSVGSFAGRNSRKETTLVVVFGGY